MASEEQDLPIHSCQSAWKVLHYVFDLHCLMDEKLFSGTMVLFVERRNEVQGDELVLDCRDLKFRDVAEVICGPDEWSQLGGGTCSRACFGKPESWFSRKEKKLLGYETEDWCIRITNVGSQVSTSVVCVSYLTTTASLSVLWRNSQDGHDCVYTAGSLINNRGLFPCQDGPGFMATWQAVVHFPAGYTCLCTGDTTGEFLSPTSMYFYTDMLLPMSTFAIAVGSWNQMLQGVIEQNSIETEVVPCRHEPYSCHFQESKAKTNLHYRVFGPSSLVLQRDVSNYISEALKKCSHIFGRIPVPRVDFLLMPRCFSSLGLCSPNLVFISQSVVMGRQPMLHRIAHELSHFWFGVNIGPKNWMEEWMSEGFATYAEDLVHSLVDPHFCRDVRVLNRWQVLQADSSNIDEDLQILTPVTGSDSVVKNGLNEEKIFSQIHYIKGYFLLLELENDIGAENFMVFLKRYVQTFHGCLVSAEEFLHFYREFNATQNANVKIKDLDAFRQKWLYSSRFEGDFDHLKTSEAYREVLEHVDNWKTKRSSRNGSKKQKLAEITNSLHADQLIAVFDNLLVLEEKLPRSVARDLIEFYVPCELNPDVEHRCCELIVQNRYFPALESVMAFLAENQSMGVYLYGELMLTEEYRFQNAARELYARIESELEPPMKKAIKELLQI